MLRLPSEALPMSRRCVGFAGREQQSVLYMEGSELCLRLARRKNLPQGSTIRRSCWCHSHPDTCPVHVLWPFFESLDDGKRPFKHISPANALTALRCVLASLGVKDAARYRTHDLRRGHARDLVLNGSSLGEILRAGQRRSPAFLQYIDTEELERDAVIEAHIDESSSEDECFDLG